MWLGTSKLSLTSALFKESILL